MRNTSRVPARTGDASATHELTIRAAWHYYVEGLTQAQVAAALRVSRAKVVRMLAAAREDGVVRIRVGAKGAAQVALERALIARFGLADAIVAPAPQGEASVAEVVGAAAATWLGEHMRDGTALGVGWGETLDAVARRIAPQPLERAAVISLLGGMTHSRGLNPSAVARRVADAFHAECYQLTAPLFVSDASMRAALWSEPGLSELRRRARRVDVALVSVGDTGAEATLFREGLLDRVQRERLLAAGAVGDVLGHFLDASGRPIEDPVAACVVALDLAELARVRSVVVASGGARKARALAAALKALPSATLITEESAASALLARSHNA